MIRLRVGIIYDINTGETFKATDYTGPYDIVENPGGYGGPNIPYSAVNATRFIWSSYLQEINASTSSVIVSGVEYEISGNGSFVWDTKTHTSGSIFISMLSGTPTLGTCVLTQTGRFCSVTTFLPAQIETSDFTPSLTGVNSLIFQDTTENLQYDVFTTVRTIDDSPISAGTYIVIGNVGDTITIDGGATYRIGEVFTLEDDFNISSGSASLVLYYATTVDDDGNPNYRYFLLDYYKEQAIKTFELQLANTICACKAKSEDKLIKCWINEQAIQNNFVGDLNLDISGTQILLDQIMELAQNNCNC